ncbi:hypothetical protein [Marinobacter shengliensis]|uniref:hypothetical protein n=1 Tax=Marinobacter shengliensis TaxID=1389223 RepID=UPI0025722233|nr:hypothetical protein [Marinobacter shengliensis]BEH14279.1 hypothetical protein MAALD49_16470 [Marinobacter shengliensis]
MTDTEAAKEAAKQALHNLIDEVPFTHDDILFLMVIATGFWPSPPAAHFHKLRSVFEPEAENQTPPDSEGEQ